MESGKSGKSSGQELKQEVKLYVNERLYAAGVIPKEVYEEAAIRIVRGG